MISLIKPLIVNITILISLTFNANLFFPFNSKKRLSMKQCLFYGVLSAFAAALCMIFPIKNLGETNFDLRMVIILVVSLYCGTIPGIICLLVVLIVRIVIGGQFVLIGIVVSLLAFITGLLFRKKYLKSRNKMLMGLGILSVYFATYIAVIITTIEFLESSFYIIYFFSFALTTLFLLFIIEKLIQSNQQFAETVYMDKLATISQMAASVAHEIRNPITTVRGFIQFLSNDTKDDNLKKFAPLIIDELDRTNLIITNYLKLAKPTDFNINKLHLNKALDDCIELLKPLGAYQNVTLINNSQGSHFIMADEQHLKQSILNIIKNGIESIEESGYVKISKRTADDKKSVTIEIEDNGRGMTTEELEKIGLPYYTTKTKGTGLGSMITNRLIREMNGTITYESRTNIGTKVSITLPSVE